MAKLIENKEEIEKVILVAVSLVIANVQDESLDELEELVKHCRCTGSWKNNSK